MNLRLATEDKRAISTPEEIIAEAQTRPYVHTRQMMRIARTKAIWLFLRNSRRRKRSISWPSMDAA